MISVFNGQKKVAEVQHLFNKRTEAESVSRILPEAEIISKKTNYKSGKIEIAVTIHGFHFNVELDEAVEPYKNIFMMRPIVTDNNCDANPIVTSLLAMMGLIEPGLTTLTSGNQHQLRL